jgi:hypothetical protein
MDLFELRELYARRRFHKGLLQPLYQKSDAYIAQRVRLIVPDETYTYKKLLKIGKEIRRAHAKGVVLLDYADVQKATSDELDILQLSCVQWESMIKSEEKAMVTLAKQLPVAGWAESVHGFGFLGLAILAAEAGDVARFDDVQALYKRLALAVIGNTRQGFVPRTIIGPERKKVWIKHGYNPNRRKAVWTITHALLMSQAAIDGPYWQHYLTKKAEYAVSSAERGWAQGAGLAKHVDNAARRFAGKRFVRDLWREWRHAARAQSALAA